MSFLPQPFEGVGAPLFDIESRPTVSERRAAAAIAPMPATAAQAPEPRVVIVPEIMYSAREVAHAFAYSEYGSGPIARWAPGVLWGSGGMVHNVRPDARPRYRDVLECREHYAAALARLNTRDDPRAEQARVWLESEIARLNASLAAFARLVADPEAPAPELGGPYHESWIGRYGAALATLQQARVAKAIASVDQVLQARDDLDVAAAFVRDLEREFKEACDAAALPALPELTASYPRHVRALESAKSLTEQLLNLSKRKGRKHETMGAAINQGLTTRREDALLWIAFEPLDAKGFAREALDLRWSAHAEALANG